MPAILSPTSSTRFRVGQNITLQGRATDAQDVTIPDSRLSWTVMRRHDTHTHPYMQPTVGNNVVVPMPGPEDFLAAGNSHLEVHLTATDSQGASATIVQDLLPNKVNVTFATQPAGRRIDANGTSLTGPQTVTSWEGYVLNVSAPAQTDSGGQQWNLASWSDGGGAAHSITTPAQAATYTATFTDTGQTLPPGSQSGLLAAYSFNEGSGTQVGDASGNGHVGAIAGAVWSPQGKFGGALSFDGVNDWVTVASTPLLNLTTGMTLEAWVFPTATTGTRDILIKEGSNVDIYNLYARNGQGLPEANVFVGGSNRTAPGTALAPNVWTHLAGTFDGNTLRLFINGAQAASAAASGAVSTSTGALRIGGNSLWGEYFQGRLDEIRVYNRALTQSEIQADMNLPVGSAAPDTTPPLRSNGLPSGTIAAGPPPAVLSLTTDENAVCRYSSTPGVAFDAMAGTFATTGATAHSTPVDESTSAGSFAFYVRCRDAAGNANPDEFTIAFTTVYVTTVSVFPTGAAVVTGTLSSGTAVNLAADDNVYYSVSSTTTGTRTAAWYGSFTGIPRSLTKLLVTYKGNNSRNCTQTVAIWQWPTSSWVQLDSRSVGTTEIAINNLAATGALAGYVGGTGASGEVRVRIQCQTTANLTSRGDIMSVTYEVASGPPPPDTTPPVRSNGQPSGALAATTAQATLSLTTDENATCRYGSSAGMAYGSMPTTFATTGSTSHATSVTGLAPGTAYSFFVRCQDAVANANTNDFAIAFSVVQGSAPAGLVAAYSFNQGAGTTAPDASGNGLVGTISGATWSTQGKFGGALSFDGQNDWVTVAATPLLNLTTGMTLEAWVLPTTTSGVRDVLIKEGANVDIYNLYARNWRGLPEANVLVGGSNQTAEAATLAANVWTHLAATYDGTTVRLFLNGAQVASAAAAGAITTSNGVLRIGGNSLWGEFFQGRIDELRIYSRALTPAEIQSDMATPIVQ